MKPAKTDIMQKKPDGDSPSFGGAGRRHRQNLFKDGACGFAVGYPEIGGKQVCGLRRAVGITAYQGIAARINHK